VICYSGNENEQDIPNATSDRPISSLAALSRSVYDVQLHLYAKFQLYSNFPFNVTDKANLLKK